MPTMDAITLEVQVFSYLQVNGDRSICHYITEIFYPFSSQLMKFVTFTIKMRIKNTKNFFEVGLLTRKHIC